MRSKLKSRLPYRFLYFLLSLAVTLTIPEGNGQYNNYPVYSTLSHGGESSNSNTGTLDGINKNVDLSSNGVSDLNLEQSQRSNQVLEYTNPQGYGKGRQSMFYYEMIPQSSNAMPKIGQTCTFTSKGMKCSYRRDGSSGGGWGEPEMKGWGEPAPMKGWGESTSMKGWGMEETGGWGEEEESGGEFPKGLLGLLGLKGLKGLKLFAPLLLPLLPLLPFLPILLPLILLAPLLLLLFIPIPVIVGGRNLGGNKLGITYVARMASDVLESEECVERIACEVARISKKLNASNWVEKVANNLPKDGHFTARVQKGISYKVEATGGESADEKSRVKSENGNCTKFACSPGPVFAKYFGNKPQKLV